MSAESQVLREPWPTRERQREAATFGLWVFLGSEVLFFGGILFAYAVLRVTHADAFQTAAREAAVIYGTINTVILLTSSLAMAIADAAVTGRRETLARGAIWAALMLGLAFLVVKGFEYAKDISEDLVPGPDFKFGRGPEQIFWAFYWIVTVIHAIHVTIGLGLMGPASAHRAPGPAPDRARHGRGDCALLAPGRLRLGAALSSHLPGRARMSDEPEPLGTILRGPLLTWGVLLVAVATTLGYAYLPGAPVKPAIGLLIAAFKIGLIATLFMRLKQADPLLRLVATGSLLWLSLLYIIGFCDYLTRLGPG